MSVTYKRDTNEVVVVIGTVEFHIDNGAPEIEQLAQYAKIMEYADSKLDTDTLNILENYASETAEDAEVLFMYNRGGRTRTYTPASMWEASGSCSEWDESAQYGYDYGWDI